MAVVVASLYVRNSKDTKSTDKKKNHHIHLLYVFLLLLSFNGLRSRKRKKMKEGEHSKVDLFYHKLLNTESKEIKSNESENISSNKFSLFLLYIFSFHSLALSARSAYMYFSIKGKWRETVSSSLCQFLCVRLFLPPLSLSFHAKIVFRWIPI